MEAPIVEEGVEGVRVHEKLYTRQRAWNSPVSDSR